MSNRRRHPPADLAAVKKSRSGYNGAVTKALDRLTAMKADEPEEIQEINTKEVDRLLASLAKTEAGFLTNLEDAQAFLPEGEEEEAFIAEEDMALDSFQASIATARDRADMLLALKGVLTGLADFRNDSKSIQDFLEINPEGNQVNSLRKLETLYQTIKEEWKGANLPNSHSLKAEVDACRKTITTLEDSVTSGRDRADTHSLDSSTSSTHSFSAPRYIISKNDLPTISVPKFSGDILDWSSFWASFQSTIGDREELSNTQRLHYLRQAITDPDLKLLLHSPAETSDFYLEVVDELKERFQKTREIHKILSRTLADLPSPKQTRTDLRKLVDLVKRTISSLKATKHYDMDSYLSSIVFSVLPSRLQTSWAQHTKRDKGVPSINQLLTYLREHVETLPSTTPPAAPQPEKPNKTPRKADKRPEYQGSRGKNVVHTVSPASSYKWDCSLCKPEKHPLHSCPKWANLNIPQRLSHIKDKNLCSNCLAGGHSTASCKSTYRCRDCSQLHHTTIHQQSPAVASISSSSSHQVPDALMTTAQVLLRGPRGQEIKARALIDSGAGLSLVSQKMAQKLGLPLEPSTLQFSAVQGVSCKPAKFITSLTISPLHNREKHITCRPAVVQMVTCDLPPEAVHPVTDLPHLMGLQLADEHYHTPGRIDILLGADLAPQIMVKELLRTGTDTEPMAQATQFGWVISGPAIRKHQSTRPVPAHHSQLQSSTDEHLDELITHFWFQEKIPGDEDLSPTEQEQKVQQHYTDTTVYASPKCRYKVTLPRNPDSLPLGESKNQAICRYLSNEKSIIKRNIWQPFQQVVQGYLDLGHAELIPELEATPAEQFYLPMHAVFKETSSSTKLRVVFDGSATTSTGTSLNSTLLVGPTLQPTLSNILLRFRCYPIALNADISKMYREVELSNSDKDLHRFVWRDSPDKPVQSYRMTRVTFGVSASPYLAVRTLQQTAEDHGEDYPIASGHIRTSFYVDDFLGGANSVQEAVELYHSLRNLLLKGSFNLTKWRSSSQEVRDHIPTLLQEQSPIKDQTSSQTPTLSKALGLVWDSGEDVMSPSINVCASYSKTKRGLISDVAKTYDLLGWIAPAILAMKLVYQTLWQTGHQWNEDVPPDIAESHATWRTDLPLLAQRTLPRCYHLPHLKPLTTELHGFSDASMKAYGAVLYCRTTYSNHPPVITLVTAKTKVAKLNPPTVPRLELCGAVLLTNLLINTAKALDIPEENWHAWTDSSIVLAWLDGQPRLFKPYVSNRVSLILQATSPNHWRHVPTEENPADCASRGMMPAELYDHSLWWTGPDWLKQEPFLEPHQPPRRTLATTELRPVHVLVTQSSIASRILESSNNYHIILARAAWLLRFIGWIRLGRPPPDEDTRRLTGWDITKARHWLLREGQDRNFSKEKHALSKGLAIPPNSRLKALNPLLDKDQLLRVGGRLANSSLEHSQQQPIISDSKEPLIIKWFEHLHLSLCHCGPSLLLNHAGSRLHILGARKLSRRVCSQCIRCRRIAPKWETQLMGNLPAPRVQPAFAFTHTGMDFAGPFTIKMGYTRKPVKLDAFLCIFVCLTYKAVHLEVVSDQTTTAFQACLRRFISRRNKPQHIYSDNGPNFTGAKNELKRLYTWLKSQETDSSIQHYLLANHGITWHNSPPAAPHFGGLWESAVKSMKRHMKRVLGTTPFTFEELTTISCQVEACLNSRPLLPITSHNQDGLSTLTASHFLLYQSPGSYPEDPRITGTQDTLKRFHQCQAMVQHIWQRWSREYLHTLQGRTKWQHQSPNLQVGDVVVLRHEKTFSCHWPLATILEVYPGDDGLVRVARIKTATGIYNRPVAKLSLLLRPTIQEPPLEPLPPGGCSVSSQPAPLQQVN